MSRIDYDAVRLYHGIDAIYSSTETHRRLREIREAYRPTDVVKRLQKTLSRKSDYLNQAESAVLRGFPLQGIDLGFWAMAFAYAPTLVHRPKKEHAAIVSLVRLGYLGIVEGLTADGQRKQVLVRV